MTGNVAQSLYSRDILRLAMALPHHEQLPAVQGTATCRSPVCGSEMTMDVALDTTGRISGLAIRAHACALGQASAAVVREKAIGLSAAEIGRVRSTLAHMLAGDGVPMEWADLEHFRYAQAYPARHGAILLPFDTVLAAVEKASR